MRRATILDIKFVLFAVTLLMASTAWPAASGKKTGTAEARFPRWFAKQLVSKNGKDGDYDSDIQNLSYGYGFADLDNDGHNEALVWYRDAFYCGTSGCPLGVFVRRKSGWRELQTIRVVHLPIRLLPTRTQGWRDIGVSVAGGGVQVPYEARLRFDGRHYGETWDTKVRRGTKATVMIRAATIPLFPGKCRRFELSPGVFIPVPIKEAKAVPC